MTVIVSWRQAKLQVRPNRTVNFATVRLRYSKYSVQHSFLSLNFEVDFDRSYWMRLKDQKAKASH